MITCNTETTTLVIFTRWNGERKLEYDALSSLISLEASSSSRNEETAELMMDPEFKSDFSPSLESKDRRVLRVVTFEPNPVKEVYYRPRTTACEATKLFYSGTDIRR
eukprot:scaffold422093_cov71-Attheya_sp.AAC.1